MITEFYEKLSAQEKKIFYVVLVLGVLALFDFLFVRPVGQKLVSLDEEIKATKRSIRQDMRFFAYKDKIFAEQKTLSIYAAEDSQIEEEITASFLKTIETLASRSNIHLSKLNTSESEVKRGYVRYFANLESDGRLQDMVNFIYRINTTKNLLKVVKFNMTENKASAENVNASMKITKLVMDSDAVKEESLAGEDVAAQSDGSPAPAESIEQPGVQGGATDLDGGEMILDEKRGELEGSETEAGDQVKGDVVDEKIEDGDVQEARIHGKGTGRDSQDLAKEQDGPAMNSQEENVQDKAHRPGYAQRSGKALGSPSRRSANQVAQLARQKSSPGGLGAAQDEDLFRGSVMRTFFDKFVSKVFSSPRSSSSRVFLRDMAQTKHQDQYTNLWERLLKQY